MSIDEIPKKIKRKLRFLKIQGENPSDKNFLKKTKDNPGIHKFSDKSPLYGFTKIRNYLRDDFMQRFKFTTVDNNIEEKKTFRDCLIFIRTIGQGIGAGSGMAIRQFRHLSQNKAVDANCYKKINAGQLWKELSEYALNKWGLVKIGFTEVPRDLIFQGNHILFKYALVFIEEMRKEYIDDAPHGEAGYETIRIYNRLGKAVLDIASWLRKNGIRCQANHPLGGLVSFVPLAGKVGLGWQGMNGLLITPEFGQRQRIAPIFIEHPLFPFTDKVPLEHAWIEEYCKTCKLCQKECPTDAIQDEKVIYNDQVPTIGRIARGIDPIKCFPMFSRFVGCSVCVKVCPFSQGPGNYDKIKKNFTEKHS